MEINIRRGGVEELTKAHDLLPEFSLEDSSFISLRKRLIDKDFIILLAESNSELVGFKAGYQTAEGEFYSWLGGVYPEYRRKGVATSLLLELESNLKGMGYKRLYFSTRNKYKAMISFGIKNNFNIFDFERMENFLDSKVWFEKSL